MRPGLERPTIRGLGADGSGRRLELLTVDGRSIPVESSGFRAELQLQRVLAVEYPLGTFLVIAERRKRGDRYWVARGYHHGRRSSVYLGREFDAADVASAAQRLADRLGDPASDPSPADSSALDAVMRDLIDRERDPARRAAAEAIAALVRRDRTSHRA